MSTRLARAQALFPDLGPWTQVVEEIPALYAPRSLLPRGRRRDWLPNQDWSAEPEHSTYQARISRKSRPK